MNEVFDKELLIEDIVHEIKQDDIFPDIKRIQLETICERYISISEERNYSIAVIQNDASKGISVKIENIFFQLKRSMEDIFAITKNVSVFNMESNLKNILMKQYKSPSRAGETNKCWRR